MNSEILFANGGFIDKQVESLKQELTSVARKINNTYATCTNEEQRSVQRELQRLQAQIEDVFKRYIGTVPSRVISSLTSQTNELLKKNIESSRVNERNEMVTTRLAKSTKASSAQAMSQDVQELKAQGVYEDKSFESETEKVLNRVIEAYKKVIDQVPSKKADLAFDQIRGCSKGAFNRIQGLHEDYTQQIKREVMKQIDMLGISISNAWKEQIEAKSEQAASSFEQQLAANVEGPDDVTQNDVKSLSENEKAFKGSEEPAVSNRAKYEAMFK